MLPGAPASCCYYTCDAGLGEGGQESVNVMASSVTSVPHWESLAKHFCLQGDTGPLRQSLELELLRTTHKEQEARRA